MSAKFNENLKQARKISGLTQKQVADAIGVARSTYALYETGEREPNVEIVKSLAKVLDVTGDYLIGLEKIPENARVFYALASQYGMDRILAYVEALNNVVNDRKENKT